MTTLSTRTTVLGVTNPKARRDPRAPLAECTALSGPLLSRFDLLLVLSDARNPDWDAAVSSHILAGGHEANAATQERPAKGQVCHAAYQFSLHVIPDQTPEHPRLVLKGRPQLSPLVFKPLGLHVIRSAAARTESRARLEKVGTCRAQEWPMARLRQYIAWVKRSFQPHMSAEAERVLQGYWHMVRGAAGKQAARSTVRMLESLVRLAQVENQSRLETACTCLDATSC